MEEEKVLNEIAVNPFQVSCDNEVEKVHSSLGISDERNNELSTHISNYLKRNKNARKNGWSKDFQAITVVCKNANELAYIVFMYTYNMIRSHMQHDLKQIAAIAKIASMNPEELMREIDKLTQK